MSNSQALGAGDGPSSLIDTKRNTDSPSSPWTNLPLSVYKLLGSKLDTNGHRAMRLVCTEWRNNVEQYVGLKVKVDDSIEGNLEFVRRVKVGNALIRNWTVNIETYPAHRLFQHPDWLKKLKLCGKMPATWKIHDLCQFPNLAHLVLRDRALHSNNLTGHQFSVLNFDLTSDLSLEQLLTKAFQTQDSASTTQPIELKSLQTLEIVKYDYYGFPRRDKVETHGYLVMAANLCFILSHVTSPVLTVAHLTVNLPSAIRDSAKLNWTLGPLHKFLDNHRTSMRQLLLPSLCGKSSDLFQHENLSNSFPINLRKLMLDLQGEWRGDEDSPETVQSDFVYLQNCIRRQTQLQEVLFNLNRFPIKWTMDAFKSLAYSCSRTLRYLELEGMTDGLEGSLDLQMLSVCHSLEVLHISSCGHTVMTIKNVEKLPVSLKRLVIMDEEDDCMEIGDPNVFKRLAVLEWLYLNVIRFPTVSNSGNQELQQQFRRTMIKGLLGLRKLQGFYLRGQKLALNTDPSLVKMLSPLDPSIDPTLRYQQNKSSCNLNWLYYDNSTSPWSDRPFDIDGWDLEKSSDVVQEPRHQAVRLDIVLGENGNEEDDDIEDDQQDEDMEFDLDEENVSSDEDDF